MLRKIMLSLCLLFSIVPVINADTVDNPKQYSREEIQREFPELTNYFKKAESTKFSFTRSSYSQSPKILDVIEKETENEIYGVIMYDNGDYGLYAFDLGAISTTYNQGTVSSGSGYSCREGGVFQLYPLAASTNVIIFDISYCFVQNSYAYFTEEAYASCTDDTGIPEIINAYPTVMQETASRPANQYFYSYVMYNDISAPAEVDIRLQNNTISFYFNGVKVR